VRETPAIERRIEDANYNVAESADAIIVPGSRVMDNVLSPSGMESLIALMTRPVEATPIGMVNVPGKAEKSMPLLAVPLKLIAHGEGRIGVLGGANESDFRGLAGFGGDRIRGDDLHRW